jgi:hypothetical protein
MRCETMKRVDRALIEQISQAPWKNQLAFESFEPGAPYMLLRHGN